MENIFLLLASPFMLIFELIRTCLLIGLGNFINFLQLYLSTSSLLFMRDFLLLMLNSYQAVFVCKFLLLWFPNINPFIAPYYVIYVLTDPIIRPLEKFLPKIFGLDFSFLVASLLLDWSVQYLKALNF
jgi:uncharacterized protein YggT (Ycf19 family)